MACGRGWEELTELRQFVRQPPVRDLVPGKVLDYVARRVDKQQRLAWPARWAPAVVHCLPGFICECVADGRWPIDRKGQLRDADLQAAARQVVGQLGSAEWSTTANRAGMAGDRAFRWWRSP